MIKKKRSTDINKRIHNLRAEVILENEKPKIKMSFSNCSFGMISAIKFKVQGYNSFSEAVEVEGNNEFTILVQDLNVSPLQLKEGVIVELPGTEIRKVNIEPYQICYSDGSIVDVEEPYVIEYEIDKLQDFRDNLKDDISESEQLTYLRKISQKAICYPKAHEKGWICTCGELNKESSNKCPICGNEKTLVFKACSEEIVFQKCIEERKRIRAEEERKRENQRKQEVDKEKKKKKIFVGCVAAAAIFILLLVLWRISYVKTYGMDKETYAQWEVALQAYEDWEDDVKHAWYGEGGYYEEVKEAALFEYTYSEIYSLKSLKEPRNELLDTVGEIDSIIDDFPEKYRPVIETLAEYQKVTYIIDVDVSTVSTMCDSSDFLSTAYDKYKELQEDIERIEGYLEDEYLHADEMDLSTDVSLSYSPKTFSYSYDEGEDYSTSTLSSSEISKAKRAADSYCAMLKNKQSSISQITYTGTNSGSGSYAYFEYKVKYSDGTVRTGTVKVKKNNSTWEATGMDMD